MLLDGLDGVEQRVVEDEERWVRLPLGADGVDGVEVRVVAEEELGVHAGVRSVIDERKVVGITGSFAREAADFVVVVFDDEPPRGLGDSRETEAET